MQNVMNVNFRGNVAVITVNHPPVNAINEDVAQGLSRSLEEVTGNGAVHAIVITGAGRTFIAGADIRVLELVAAGQAAKFDLHPLLTQIEDSAKPVIVAMHGTTLGGGNELAMAAHYRVAKPEAQIGQPEVNLGIIPGAEGTQRLPRLVGIAAALDMCITGKPIKATEALKLGLVDRLIEGDLVEGAVAFAREMLAKGVHPKTRDRSEKLGSPPQNAPLFAAAREQAARIRRNQTAPLVAVEAIEVAATLPFAEGCRRERELSLQCLASDQARAFIHAFFAERAAAKVPGIPRELPPSAIQSVGIVGAGTMGTGISIAMANAGINVLLKDEDNASLERAVTAIDKSYESSVQRGRMTTDVALERKSRIRPQITLEGFGKVDLVIEAVFENMALKRDIFRQLDKVARDGCILASNTSTLDIDEIAAATSRPESVVGLHFFSPAQVMRLVEIVRGEKTAAPVISEALSTAKRLGKVGVVVGNCMGFVGNRMMFPYMREAQFLVEDGATPTLVDAALYDFGMAMGIFAVDDLGGIDVMWRVRREHKQFQIPGQRRPLVADRLYEINRLGQKTAAGWYRYDENRKPIRDPEVEKLIEETAVAAGIRRRDIGKPEIVERCIYALINEGARILEEGYALRAADIDTIYIAGYGFPAYRGGPMWYADTVGLKTILQRIEDFHQQHGELWEPAPLLIKLAVEGRTFSDFDRRQEERIAQQ
jgi:3-hydroxyacyl-CoA dehydrogenase